MIVRQMQFFQAWELGKHPRLNFLDFVVAEMNFGQIVGFVEGERFHVLNLIIILQKTKKLTDLH